MLERVIKEYGGIEVSALEVYSDIFKLGDHMIQRVNEPSGAFISNPLGYMKNNGYAKGAYRIFFEDTFADTLTELQQADFAIMNGLTYFGRKNTQENASKMYALIIDLDGVTEETLNNFFYSATNKDYNVYPLPNYVILSGNGLHLYFLFEFPLPLYPNIKLQLKELKYALTQKIWNKYTTTQYEKVQFQGINQGFRVIGGKTKIPGKVVRAFRMNTHPFTIKQLNQYVPEDKWLDEDKLWKESKMSLAVAKKKFPQWYERRVLNQEPKGTWTCKEDLYLWWLRKIESGAVYGHRYFCIMCLAIYAVKSGVSFEQLESDAIGLIPFMNSLNASESFTEEDVRSALECYDERYRTFPINDIVKLSAIKIEKNKRNGRSRTQHMRIVNATNSIKRELGEQIGRPSKKDIIDKHITEHPDDTVTEIARALKVSRSTVYKYIRNDGEDDLI